MVRQHLLDFLFQKAAKAALGELSIQYWPSQIDKVIQLNSTLQVRHGVMLVGPAGGGKTTTRQILKRALVVLPSIQAREQLEMKGTGDYPEETGSSKTAQSHAVWEFARLIFVMGQFYRLYPAVTVKRNFFSVQCWYTFKRGVNEMQIYMSRLVRWLIQLFSLPWWCQKIRAF